MGKRTPKQPRGRPVTREMPATIADTPESVARVLMNTPPPKEWQYLKEHKKKESD